MQVGSRRSSTRLQEKDDALARSDGKTYEATSKSVAKDHAPGSTKNKKRKNNYEEDDDGFTFSRVGKNKKPKQSAQDETKDTQTRELTKPGDVASAKSIKQDVNKSASSASHDGSITEDRASKRRKKMSFSTPKGKDTQQPVRRSKRLSGETTRKDDAPLTEIAPDQPKLKRKLQPSPNDKRDAQTPALSVVQNAEDKAPSIDTRDEEISDSRHISTKIALPFADTPVIRRNKAMREGKSVRGERRSSLGLRGRRASSLIETGNSNALPHQEVDTTDFYKHIESDLIEPRRMRQLLTWCATRAMHAKPKGTDFEDASAKSAARVIEEELLKELSNRSELSDWFNREEIPEIPKMLPERPNPKNVQNTQKIAELEEQINRLKSERDALQQLLRPPNTPEIDYGHDDSVEFPEIDRTLLSDEDAALLDVLRSRNQQPDDISQRLDKISSSIGPTVDMFADGIHKVAQYRIATDNVAGKVLAICASRLATYEKEARKKALHAEEERSPGRDLSSVLRGLSKADR